MTGTSILVVDDDPDILRVVRRAREAHGYDVAVAEDGQTARAQADLLLPDVVLLDLVLPDVVGIELCEALLAPGRSVVVLSAVEDERWKVLALDAGADDYVTKPFGSEELLARVRAAFRRQGGRGPRPVLEAGPIRVDLAAREVQVNGQVVHFTPTEFDLLRLLLQEPDRVLTQRFILARVWGPEYEHDSHILRTFVHQLRQKLGAISAEAEQMIRTDPGVGYRMVVPKPA
jgi:two-component system KDP operon response regulator KdpE